MIEAVGLTKRYGATVAVEDLSFTVPAGQVTGFLGPNGSGKSTTMRLIVGLDAPTSGSVTINGQPFRSLVRPLRHIGALLDATAPHPGRSARKHLLWMALSNGIDRRRVDVVLEQVGLDGVARRRVGGFSVGMAQRLGIAAALLGDPDVLVFDEPVNGLDPEGVLWIRTLLTSLAEQGRTVLLSSHLMSEMEITADRLIIVGRGRLIAEVSMTELLQRGPNDFVLVRSLQGERLACLLKDRGASVSVREDLRLEITGIDPGLVGHLATANGVELQELSVHHASLEQIYMQLTGDKLDFRTPATTETRP